MARDEAAGGGGGGAVPSGGTSAQPLGNVLNFRPSRCLEIAFQHSEFIGAKSPYRPPQLRHSLGQYFT